MLTGLILAGGKSRRMGRDKAAIRINQQTMLQHSQAILTAAGCQDILISSNDIDGAIADRYQNIGPVAGIESAVHYLIEQQSTTILLVVPVDMLLLRVATLMQLKSAVSDSEIARFDNMPLPLALAISSSLYEKIESLAKEAEYKGGISIKAMCQALDSTIIQPEQQQLAEFFNCNTTKDLESLKHYLT